MRRVRYPRYGGPEVLELSEVPAPEPGPGQVLIRVEAIAANFIDSVFRSGKGAFQRPLPGILTGDVVGRIEAVGPDVDAGRIGERVAALVEDAYADLVLADDAWTAALPDGLDAATATSVPLAGPVALRSLRLGRLAAGETVLVHSAAGGIGHLAVQLAKVLGAGTVIGTAGSAAKLDFARSVGADVAVDYTDDDWPDRVRAAAPGGVDVVLDAVGGETMRRSIDLLAPLGRLVAYGAAGGELGAVEVRSLFPMRYVVGYSLLAWRAADPAAARADVAEVADHLAAGRIRTSVHATFPLTGAADAHRLLDDRAQAGRLLLIP